MNFDQATNFFTHLQFSATVAGDKSSYAISSPEFKNLIKRLYQRIQQGWSNNIPVCIHDRKGLLVAVANPFPDKLLSGHTIDEAVDDYFDSLPMRVLESTRRILDNCNDPLEPDELEPSELNRLADVIHIIEQNLGNTSTLGTVPRSSNKIWNSGERIAVGF